MLPLGVIGLYSLLLRIVATGHAGTWAVERGRSALAVRIGPRGSIVKRALDLERLDKAPDV